MVMIICTRKKSPTLRWQEHCGIFVLHRESILFVRHKDGQDIMILPGKKDMQNSATTSSPSTTVLKCQNTAQDIHGGWAKKVRVVTSGTQWTLSMKIITSNLRRGQHGVLKHSTSRLSPTLK